MSGCGFADKLNFPVFSLKMHTVVSRWGVCDEGNKASRPPNGRNSVVLPPMNKIAPHCPLLVSLGGNLECLAVVLQIS